MLAWPGALVLLLLPCLPCHQDDTIKVRSGGEQERARTIDQDITVGPFTIQPKEYAKQLVNLGEDLEQSDV